MEASGTLELTLPSEPGSVAEARMRVLEAVGPELDDGQIDALRLLVSELVTNAVRHGGHEEPLELHAHWNSEVRIEVTDHGNGFTPAPRTGAPDEPGGFGLFLVGRLADRWGVDTNDATRVWFVLRRH
jgi:anti-sigma regulatory factor (Ser/Thr protein kinase)